jgi:hypothetical protein
MGLGGQNIDMRRRRQDAAGGGSGLPSANPSSQQRVSHRPARRRLTGFGTPIRTRPTGRVRRRRKAAGWSGMGLGARKVFEPTRGAW